MDTLKGQLLVWFWLFFSCGLVKGATSQAPVIDLFGKSFNCRLALEVKKETTQLTPDELSQFIKEEQHEVEEILKQDLTRKEKKILKDHLRLMTELLEMSGPDRELHHFFDQLCLNSEDVLKTSFKGLGMATNFIALTIGFPFRYFSNVISGAKNGIHIEHRPLSSYEILGGNRNSTMGFFLFYRSLKMTFGASPMLAPFLITPFVNTYIMIACENFDILSTEDKNYCKKFMQLKEMFFKKAQTGEALGIKLHKHRTQDVKVQWRQEVTESNFCEYLETVALAKTPQRKSQEFREIMVSQLHPGDLARPDAQIFQGPDSSILHAPLSSMTGGRNVVVSLSPPNSIVEQMVQSGRWQEYLDLQKRVSDETKRFNKLYRLKDLRKCLAQKKAMSFSIQTYNELKQNLDKYKNESLYQQHQIIRKVFKSLRNSQLQWELVSSHSLNTVRELMQSGEVANLVIITHSVGDYKKMIDANFNQFPSTFFRTISPALMSLSFFTCHSQNIIETYELKQLFESAPSFYQKRQLNFVKANDILSEGDTVPLAGFGEFLTTVDESLAQLLAENLAAHAIMKPTTSAFMNRQCSLTLNDVEVLQGSFSLILNREFIGNINQLEKRGVFYFSCDLLKARNTLLLQNSSLVDSLELRTIPGTILINQNEVQSLEWKNFYDQKSHFASSKIIF